MASAPQNRTRTAPVRIDMVAASLGLLRPTVGAGLQEAIDIAVIVNALRTSR